ncbi:MAG: hydrogenase nickel incorporation protein HypB [Lachnospiraceae bacterium]|nr:hydrogenase nickel incorporation protein HypB [Lachnospiraceae bacterium]
MNGIRIREVKEGIISQNDITAAGIRSHLAEKHIFFVNVMGSPGCGKTTFLKRTVEALAGKAGIGVMEADVDSDTDAVLMEKTGADVIQLHTGGACHMDAHMTKEGLNELGDEFDIIFLENVGNLVCPAEFDVGAHLSVMILGIPEGDDKPLKYPLMFKTSDVLIINKTDAGEAFDFNEELFRERVLSLNPDIRIFSLSAKTGAGFDGWMSFIKEKYEDYRA